MSRVDLCTLTRIRARFEVVQVKARKSPLDPFVSHDLTFSLTLYTFPKPRA
ncbi:hypothetical protein CDL15_Pgr002616 [Punica granatum]|uniref:Uncharacterized protein n=1 Tax=Punica granatum TaxID=22663 RepID=A0A218W3K3_PUNGR|nr:hypothetical protein CDL15_Pgr002616 [Punica granatum]